MPGNHDWFDGLGCFLRYVVYRDRLGGWFLPQTKSYFAIELPKNWWILGFDDGLEGEMDARQCAYFSALAETFNDNVNVIVMTHHPNWVTDDYNKKPTSTSTATNDTKTIRKDKDRMQKRLEYLMNTKLKGKVRIRLAGDVHNYMRHIPVPASNDTPSTPSTSSTTNTTDTTDTATTIAPPVLIISGGGGAFLHPTHCLGNTMLENVAGTDNTNYQRAAAYPSSATSASMSIQNIFKFRKRNWKFDLIGGFIYLLLAHPLFAGCSLMSTIDNNDGTNIVLHFMSDVVFVALPKLLSSSTLSTFVILILWFFCVFAVDSQKLGIQFWWGSLHAASHVCCAIAVTVFIDYVFGHLAVYGNLGQGGLDLQWNLFTKFDNEKSPENSPLELFDTLTFGIVPTFLRYSMYVADSTQTQFIVRQQMCNRTKMSGSNGGIHGTSKEEDVLYLIYLFLRLVWFWILACPIVSTVIAGYLWLSVGYLGMHWNEGFSSLQHSGYKNFVRMKIKKNGDLELFVIGIDKVPNNWVLDPERVKKETTEAVDELMKEYGEDGEDGDGDVPSHRLKRPSKWVEEMNGKPTKRNEMEIRLVDHFVIHSKENQKMNFE